MATVAALAGRRIDSPDAKIERFPTRNIKRVATQLQYEFEQRDVRWLVCSAAAGADLISLQTAQQLGILCRVVLSPSLPEFSRSSVEDRGMRWKRDFDQRLAEVMPNNLVLVPAQTTPAGTFRAINERILSEAISLSASTFSQ